MDNFDNYSKQQSYLILKLKELHYISYNNIWYIIYGPYNMAHIIWEGELVEGKTKLTLNFSMASRLV